MNVENETLLTDLYQKSYWGDLLEPRRCLRLNKTRKSEGKMTCLVVQVGLIEIIISRGN